MVVRGVVPVTFARWTGVGAWSVPASPLDVSGVKNSASLSLSPAS